MGPHIIQHQKHFMVMLESLQTSGAYLLELFSGRHAWGTLKHNNEVVGSIVKKVLPPAMMYLSTKWKTICLQCIAYEPNDRKPIEEILQAIWQLP